MTALATLAVGSVLAVSTHDAKASSHREAPFITKNPKVDATDFYMFRSYEPGRAGMVTILANYIPLEDAYGGPNYFTFDPEALYEIHIDNNGDAKEDMTFQFRFQNALAGLASSGIGTNDGKTLSIPLINQNVGAPGTNPKITMVGDSNLDVNETYTVNLVRGDRRTGTSTAIMNGSSTTFTKPVDYIGPKSLGNPAAYETYAKKHVATVTIPGCTDSMANQAKIFVGQRAEGFAVNLGLIFDLVNSDLGTIADATKRDLDTADPSYNNTLTKNVGSIAIELPAACLQGPVANDHVVGAWTTASVRQVRVINPNPTYDKPVKEGGAWVQVSRLGMPLVNEVVIGLKDKDKFNSSVPSGDTQFADYVTDPTMPKLLDLLFGTAALHFPVSTTRNDLVTIFLKGVPNINQPATVTASEMLRMNLGDIAGATVKGKGAQFNLGAAACFPNGNFTPVPANANCDPYGFPNGRRPGDDVVDIELTALGGYFLPVTAGFTNGTIIHDAVLQDSKTFAGGADPTVAEAVFPYLNTPHSGDH
jgi:hypothetical protein